MNECLYFVNDDVLVIIIVSNKISNPIVRFNICQFYKGIAEKMNSK